jgi:hypothetical protein
VPFDFGRCLMVACATPTPLFRLERPVIVSCYGSLVFFGWLGLGFFGYLLNKVVLFGRLEHQPLFSILGEVYQLLV